MSNEYLLDRLAIEDTLIRFASAMDEKCLELLDQIFTADAVLDYAYFWGPGNPGEFRAWAESTLSRFTACRHLLSNVVVDIEGDVATAKCDFYNPIFMGNGDSMQVSHAYGSYHDTLIRSAAGWRISRREMKPIVGLDPNTLN